MRQHATTWALLLSPSAAIAVFAGTALPYLTAPNGSTVGYAPLCVGVALFTVLSGYAAYLVRGTVGVSRWQIALESVVGGVVFFSLFMFLVIGTKGS